MRVRTFIIWWRDKDSINHEDWIQALDVDQALEILGINKNDVVAVAVEMPRWWQSKRR